MIKKQIKKTQYLLLIKQNSLNFIYRDKFVCQIKVHIKYNMARYREVLGS